MFTTKQREGVKEVLTFYIYQLYFIHLPQNIYKEQQEDDDNQFIKRMRFTQDDLLKQSVGQQFEQTIGQIHKFFQDCLKQKLPEASFKKMIVFSFIPQIKTEEYEKDGQFNALKLLLILLNQQLKEYLLQKTTIQEIIDQTKNPQKLMKYKDKQITKITKIIERAQHLLEIQLTGQDITKYTKEEVDEQEFLKYKQECQFLKKQLEVTQQKIMLLQKQNTILKDKVTKLQESQDTQNNLNNFINQQQLYIPQGSSKKQQSNNIQPQLNTTKVSTKLKTKTKLFNNVNQGKSDSEQSESEHSESDSQQSEDESSQKSSHKSSQKSQKSSNKSSNKSQKHSFEFVCQKSQNQQKSKKKLNSNSFKTQNELSTFFNE